MIVESGSVSYGKATPYLPVIDLLKAYFKIHDRDNQRDDARESHRQAADIWTRRLESTLPAFLSLLDVAVEDQQWQNLDPFQRRRRTLDAIKRLFLRESQVQPVILVFEDLHWIDSETQSFLDSLIDSFAHCVASPSRQLSSRIPAWLGQQDLLSPVADRSAAARER